MLISQLDQFDKLIEARDSSGLGKDSRDYIRLKVQINGELRKLEDAVKDLAEQNKREVEKRGSKLGADDIAARREVLEAVIGEFQTKFKMAKGFSSAGAAENLGGGAGMRVLSREQVMKGQFAGAGIKTKQEAASAARAPRARRARASMRRARVRWAGGRACACAANPLGSDGSRSPLSHSAFPLLPTPPSLPSPASARAQLTGEQQQKMAQLQAVSQEQDGVLDEISKGVDELKDLAEKMQASWSARASERARESARYGARARARAPV